MPARAATRSSEPKRFRFACRRCAGTTAAPTGTQRARLELCSPCFGKGADRRPRDLNDLSGAEWARYSRSVEEYPDTRSEKQRQHGACFPLSLARQQIEIFTKKGDLVFDPFLGVGTTLEAAQELGRNGLGIELNPAFAKLARRDLKPGARKGLSHRVIVDDAQKMADHLPAASVDFLLTSPPYAGLLKSVKGAFAYKWREHSRLDPIENPRPYSARAEDLGNMGYLDFMAAIRRVMQESFRVLRAGAYAVWVVKDFRDLRRGAPYVNFHGDAIAAAEAAGFRLWDIRIYNQTRFRPLVCLGFPSSNFYLNIGHSYLLTFRAG